MITIDLSRLPDEGLLIGSLVDKVAMMHASYGDCNGRCSHPSGNCNDDFCKKNDCRECSIQYASGGREDCYGCCLECSEEVHYGRSWRDAAFRNEYDCQKLIYYYTCRYSWKYCSEIMYALESVDLSKYDFYSVLSLGCGQSPDLMAIEQENRFDGKGVSYIGYDINPYWESVQDEIRAYCSSHANMNCRYESADIIKTLDNSQGIFADVNVIVMSYLLSSFPDGERRSKTTQLFDLLISKVLAYKEGNPVLIIVNDIDHNTKARNHFDILTRKIQESGYHCNVQRRHFSNRNGNYRDGSTQYDSNENKFLISDTIKKDFHCALYCTSAQCIIEVN